MITDALLTFSSAQAVTTTAVSQNTVDLGLARNTGAGEDMYVAITVDAAAVASGAATVTFQLIASDTPNLASPTVLSQTDAIPKTELTAGRRPIYMEMPRSQLISKPLGQRYLGVQYVVGTGPLTAGAFSATMTHDVQDMGQFFASGFTVA